MAEPIAVTDATFEQEVIKSDLPVLVDFWAAWCGPCRVIGPIVEEIAKEYDGKLKVCKVDVDADKQNAGALGISSIPTLFVYKGGKPVDHIIGAVPKAMLKQIVDKHIG